MLFITFLLTLSVGLINCNWELSKRSNLACEELCNLVLNKFFFNKSRLPKEHTPFVNPDSDILKHDIFNYRTLDQYLEVSSIIYGLSKIANRTVVNKQCFKDLKSIENGILGKEPWAMKVLDSSGEKASGFIWGHSYWLGSRRGCDAVQDPVQITLSNQFERIMNKKLLNQMAPFKMDYRVVYMTHNSPWQVDIKFLPEGIIHVGLCLPSSCSSPEIKNLTQTLMDTNQFENSKILELNAEVLYVKDLKLKDSFFEQKSFKIFTGCLFFTLLMTLMAWFLSDTNVVKPESTIAKLLRFIKCFDFVKNTRELFTSAELSPRSIPVINGMRSICCLWIVMGHILVFIYFTINNKTFGISDAERPAFQFITILILLVDVFFTISGFLQAHNFLKNEKKIKEIRENTLWQNMKAYGKSVFHRYLRLAPLELFMIATVALFTSYIEDVSVFHISYRFDQTCSKYWWRNVLFIQNFFDHNELCLIWTWSLACDMQFFCFITACLFVYAKRPRFSIIRNLFVTGLFASIIWTYISGLKHNYQFSFDLYIHSLTELYVNPFIRIVPYIVGAMAGWFFVQNKGNFKIDSTTEKFLWNMAALVFFVSMYSYVKRDLSPFASTTILVVSRLSMSLVVCWLIIASATGRGTWWSRILECNAFQHINRISYSIYLVNPLIITCIFSFSSFSSHVEPIQMLAVYSGFGVIVYLASIILSLGFEIPFNNLSSLLVKRNVKIE